MFHHILVPSDAKPSKAAARAAIALARRPGGTLSMYQAADPSLARVFAVLAFSAAACFAASTAEASEAQATFKARCGDCHGMRDVQHWGRRHVDAAARRTWLEQFLRRHYPPPEAERALIVDYIQSAIAAASAPR